MLINHPLSDTQHTAGVHGKFSRILISKRYLAKSTISLLVIYISEGKLKSLFGCSLTLCDTELVTYTVNILRWEPHFSTIFHILIFTFLFYFVSLPSEFGDICEKLSRDTCSTLELIASSASTASMFTRLEDCNKGRACERAERYLIKRSSYSAAFPFYLTAEERL